MAEATLDIVIKVTDMATEDLKRIGSLTQDAFAAGGIPSSPSRAYPTPASGAYPQQVGPLETVVLSVLSSLIVEGIMGVSEGESAAAKPANQYEVFRSELATTFENTANDFNEQIRDPILDFIFRPLAETQARQNEVYAAMAELGARRELIRGEEQPYATQQIKLGEEILTEEQLFDRLEARRELERKALGNTYTPELFNQYSEELTAMSEMWAQALGAGGGLKVEPSLDDSTVKSWQRYLSVTQEAAQSTEILASATIGWQGVNRELAGDLDGTLEALNMQCGQVGHLNALWGESIEVFGQSSGAADELAASMGYTRESVAGVGTVVGEVQSGFLELGGGEATDAAAAAIGVFHGTSAPQLGELEGLVGSLQRKLLGMPAQVSTRIALWVPTGWAMRGFHDIVTRGLGLADVLQEAGVLALFGIAFLALGVWRFRYE